MSIPTDEAWRGCASNYPAPVSEDDVQDAEAMYVLVRTINTEYVDPPVNDIVYRSSHHEEDICRHAYRWDLTPYDEAIDNGFRARIQAGTEDVDYCNLYNYIHHGGRPLDSRRDTSFIFVSTTINPNWHPTVDEGAEVIVYRYEIYAPGGIWVAQTLGDRYQYTSQNEIAFVRGVAPQYIRSAQAFRLSRDRGSQFTRRQRVDDTIIINTNFNPDPQRLVRIRNPTSRYQDDQGNSRHLNVHNYPLGPPQLWMRKKRDVSTYVDATNRYYASDVANFKSYIDAAFRASSVGEAYLFMNNQYALVNYAPGDDSVLNGPLLICEGFPSLMDTAFGEHGIDCAFGSHHGDEAFIFSGNLCAQINYAPGTTDDWIIKGPMTIAAMFSFFQGTEFEKGVDAAFETEEGEAYIFRGNEYALINYRYEPYLVGNIYQIVEGFPCLEGTIFENGIDAAFASHRSNEAFIFNGDSYALIWFHPGAMGEMLGDGVEKIFTKWPSFATILPVQNDGLDLHNHAKPEPDRDHDEL